MSNHVEVEYFLNNHWTEPQVHRPNLGQSLNDVADRFHIQKRHLDNPDAIKIHIVKNGEKSLYKPLNYAANPLY